MSSKLMAMSRWSQLVTRLSDGKFLLLFFQLIPLRLQPQLSCLIFAVTSSRRTLAEIQSEMLRKNQPA